MICLSQCKTNSLTSIKGWLQRRLCKQSNSYRKHEDVPIFHRNQFKALNLEETIFLSTALALVTGLDLTDKFPVDTTWANAFVLLVSLASLLVLLLKVIPHVAGEKYSEASPYQEPWSAQSDSQDHSSQFYWLSTCCLSGWAGSELLESELGLIGAGLKAAQFHQDLWVHPGVYSLGLSWKNTNAT